AALEGAADSSEPSEPDTAPENGRDARRLLDEEGPRSGTAETQGAVPAEMAPRRPAALWAVTAALAVAVLAAGPWAVAASPPAPPRLPPPGGGARERAPPPAPGAQAPASELVDTAVASEPRGAAVFGSQGRLGPTPLTARLPASTETERLRFEKPGYRTAFYEVRPRSAGAVFVELQRAP